jgi:F-type H+-transporting ATPase subunit a
VIPVNVLLAAEHGHHEPSPFEHVMDTSTWEFFESLFGDKVEWHLPKVLHFQITKFMILELVAAVLIVLIYIPLAKRSREGGLPRGSWWNAFESLLTFVRNEVARPNLGDKDADRYVPYLWTLFLFILFCNLLGMIPFMGSPTANIWATGGLALISFIMLHGAAIVKMGHDHLAGLGGHGHGHDGHGHDDHGHGHDHGHVAGKDSGLIRMGRSIPVLGTLVVGVVYYLKSLWPSIDVPYVGWLFSGMIFVIELMGSVIKSGVLAVRLFANMFAGHMVLAMILLFIVKVAVLGNAVLFGGVTIASVLGVVALSLLEIFVAFLQAYIFTFLTALFMGMSLHPQH